MPTIFKIADYLSANEALEILTPEGQHTIIQSPSAKDVPIIASVVFIGATSKTPEKIIELAGAGLAIIDAQLRKNLTINSATRLAGIIWSNNPRLDFCRVLSNFFDTPQPIGLHATAVIATNAIIGERCYIGPGCVISNDVVIGEDSKLVGRVFVYPGTKIGKRALIHAGVVIGSDGFGFEKRSDGSWQKFPHMGGVVISDDVEIGANTTIDRGTLNDTVIEAGVKIDNLVHIAHNSRIGADSLIIAGAVVCGSVHLGPRSWVSPQSSIKDGLTIGEEVTIGMGAVVTSDMHDREAVVGWPANTARQSKKIFSFLKQIVISNKQKNQDVK